jgi:K+-sensing histidine kinase KdpD
MKDNQSDSSFNKIATAIAFSPRAEAILCESKAIASRLSASLLLIHIGVDVRETRQKLSDLCNKVGLTNGSYELVFHPGVPVDSIVTACNENDVDLLIVGALQEETFWQFYFGSIARKLSRNVNCSILLLTNPSIVAKPFKHVIVNGVSNDKTMRTINTAIDFAKRNGTKLLEIVREVKRGKMTKVEDDETLKELTKQLWTESP